MKPPLCIFCEGQRAKLNRGILMMEEGEEQVVVWGWAHAERCMQLELRRRGIPLDRVEYVKQRGQADLAKILPHGKEESSRLGSEGI